MELNEWAQPRVATDYSEGSWQRARKHRFLHKQPYAHIHIQRISTHMSKIKHNIQKKQSMEETPALYVSLFTTARSWINWDVQRWVGWINNPWLSAWRSLSSSKTAFPGSPPVLSGGPNPPPTILLRILPRFSSYLCPGLFSSHKTGTPTKHFAKNLRNNAMLKKQKLRMCPAMSNF